MVGLLLMAMHYATKWFDGNEVPQSVLNKQSVILECEQVDDTNHDEELQLCLGLRSMIGLAWPYHKRA